MKKRHSVIAAVALGLATSAMVTQAFAAGATDLAHLHTGQPSRTPIGWQPCSRTALSTLRTPRCTIRARPSALHYSR